MSEELITQMQTEDLDTLLTKLSESYDEEVARIDRAIDIVGRKQNELLAAAADTSEVPFESIVRVKQREADELAVNGEPEAARAKLQEAEDARAVPQRLEEAYHDCVLEKAMLENDQKNAARKVLDEWMPSAVLLIRAEERKLADMLNRLAEEIEEFIELTGNTGVLGRDGGIDAQTYLDSLPAHDGQEWENIRKWYHVVEQNYIRRR